MSTCPFQKLYPSALQKDPDFFMAHAYNLAIDAWNADEVPIGAVMVHQNEIISTAHNQTRSQTDPTAHAEMIAITMAARKIG
ncbi:MAG: nucleoside deaminase, partial [Opitutales bacterium]